MTTRDEPRRTVVMAVEPREPPMWFGALIVAGIVAAVLAISGGVAVFGGGGGQ